MGRLKRFKKWNFLLFIFLIFTLPNHPESNFEFVFMTDIHLISEKGAVEALQRAIRTINQIKPDFVITGGDSIMDANAGLSPQSEGLFELFLNQLKSLQPQVYHVVGNREQFGTGKESPIKPIHPEYGNKMFTHKVGPTYQWFQHKGWHFFLLDSIKIRRGKKYQGEISTSQIQWLKSKLKTIEHHSPIVLCTHIPFLSPQTHFEKGPLAEISRSHIVHNARQVLDLFEGYNLKLILQGHVHVMEAVYTQGIWIITGGALSGKWWEGPYKNTEEGFLKISIKKDKVFWRYIDIGWEAEEEKESCLKASKKESGTY